jgi:hypothetical protein
MAEAGSVVNAHVVTHGGRILGVRTTQIGAFRLADGEAGPSYHRTWSPWEETEPGSLGAADAGWSRHDLDESTIQRIMIYRTGPKG